MKEEVLAMVRGLPDPGQALNRLREYLQAFVLRSFHESEAFRPPAFVDTRPPAWVRCERRVVTRHVTFLRQYYDPPSLLAGKLLAAITRKYAKGRDWYDLVWYLSQRPPALPNLPLLQNALDQTQGVGRHNALSWRELVRERLSSL